MQFYAVEKNPCPIYDNLKLSSMSVISPTTLHVTHWNTAIDLSIFSRYATYTYQFYSQPYDLFVVTEAVLRPVRRSRKTSAAQHGLCRCFDASIESEIYCVPHTLKLYSMRHPDKELQLLPTLCEHELKRLPAKKLLSASDSSSYTIIQNERLYVAQLIFQPIQLRENGVLALRHMLFQTAVSQGYYGSVAWSATFVGNQCIDSGLNPLSLSWNKNCCNVSMRLTLQQIEDRRRQLTGHARRYNDIMIVLFILEADTVLWSYIGTTKISVGYDTATAAKLIYNYATTNHLTGATCTELIPHLVDHPTWMLYCPSAIGFRGSLFKDVPNFLQLSNENALHSEEEFKKCTGVKLYDSIATIHEVWEKKMQPLQIFVFTQIHLYPLLFCWALEHQKITFAMHIIQCLYSFLCRNMNNTSVLLSIVMLHICEIGDDYCTEAIELTRSVLQRYKNHFEVAEATHPETVSKIERAMDKYTQDQGKQAVSMHKDSKVLKSIKKSSDMMLKKKSRRIKTNIMKTLCKVAKCRARIRVTVSKIYSEAITCVAPSSS